MVNTPLTEDVLGQLVKSSEGTHLALAALSEILEKMHEKMEKEEEMEMQKQAELEMKKQQEHDAVQRTTLINEIASAVIKQVQELNADQFHKVSHPSNKAQADDYQESAKLRTATGEVQKPIQAMEKGKPVQKHTLLDENQHPHIHPKEEEDMMATAAEKEPMMGEEEPKAIEDEYPKKEEFGSDVVKSIMAAVSSLKKEIVDLKKGMDIVVQKQATTLADKILAEKGWHKEISKTPMLIPETTLGSTSINIQKSASDPLDIVDKLADLSWGEIANMYTARNAGITDGLPKEILGQ